MFALRRILLKDKRIFVNEKTIQQRRDKYEMAANPVSAFLRIAVDKESLEDSDWTSKDIAYRAFQRFCKHFKLRCNVQGKIRQDFKTDISGS